MWTAALVEAPPAPVPTTVFVQPASVHSDEMIRYLQQLGAVRYWITAFLFMTMVGTCLKVVLRLAFNVKYVFASPWINV